MAAIRPGRPAPPRRSARTARTVAGSVILATAALVVGGAGAVAQDLNFVLPIPDIEEHLRELPFEIIDWRGSRAPDDRTQQATLQFEDESVLRVKWANAAVGASMFNNEPRYEVAAYEIQKLFLDHDEFVVPPTILRAFPLQYASAYSPGVRPTFREAESVVVSLQYWLSFVTQDGFWDPRRAREDTVYARHIGNFNVLTYLINHSDANVGNFLISRWEENPRVFSVDNGVAFRSAESDRGAEWRELHVARLPAHTVERLRRITLEDLQQALATLVEFRVEDGQLVAVPPGDNLSPNRGVRRQDGRIQLGLTTAEIRDIDRRRQSLIRSVDRGRIRTF
jgi:hypothetical protein